MQPSPTQDGLTIDQFFSLPPPQTGGNGRRSHPTAPTPHQSSRARVSPRGRLNAFGDHVRRPWVSRRIKYHAHPWKDVSPRPLGKLIAGPDLVPRLLTSRYYKTINQHNRWKSKSRRRCSYFGLLSHKSFLLLLWSRHADTTIRRRHWPSLQTVVEQRKSLPRLKPFECSSRPGVCAPFSGVAPEGLQELALEIKETLIMNDLVKAEPTKDSPIDPGVCLSSNCIQMGR